MIRKWCNQRDIPTPKKQIDNKAIILREHIVSRVSFFSQKAAAQLHELNKISYENIHKVHTAQQFHIKT